MSRRPAPQALLAIYAVFNAIPATSADIFQSSPIQLQGRRKFALNSRHDIGNPERNHHSWLRSASPRGGNQVTTSQEVVAIPEKRGHVMVEERDSKSHKPNAVSLLQTRHRQVQRTTQTWMRRQFWALLALRFAFALLAPISLVALVVLFVAGTVAHATFLVTLTFCAGQSRAILTSLTKAALAVFLASLCGVLLPVFAAFGLVISILQCGLELTEPILRIRYQRQLRKIRHLHTLLTDPVLVETLQSLLRGANTVTAMTQRQLAASANASQRRITASARASQKKLAEMADSGHIAASALASTELVEQLVAEVSADSKFLADLKGKTSPAVWRWTRQQYEALKESGLLEAAAKRAIQALQGELESASEFLPYLDAIEKVRREQQERLLASKPGRKGRRLFSSK